MLFSRKRAQRADTPPQGIETAPLMEWRDQFSVGIPSVDRQHKVLIKYINQLHIASQREDGGALEVGHILGGLISYTKVHFAYEEMMFRTYQYPETDDHMLSHQRVLEKVAWYKRRFDNQETGIAKELLDLLIYWLNHHILQEDMAYSQYLIKKGAR
ncbi:MAG TPA: bacteriohemerythrin [Candidatus Tenderia sp.]|nr:bacteriohemerythrin [Candidatus Tenderia sp.]